MPHRSNRTRKNGRRPKGDSLNSGAAAAPERSSTAEEIDVWKNSSWGSRQSFIQARIEKEGYSPEAAEHRADMWERALRDLKENPPESLRLE